MSLLNYFRTPIGLKEYDPGEFKMKIDEGNHRVIDVRTKSEYRRDHISEAELIPLRNLRRIAHEMNRSRSYLLVCATGHRSRAAASIMLKNGFKGVGHLKGGMMAWHTYQKQKH